MTIEEIKALDNAELGKRISEAIGWALVESVVVENGYVETSSGGLFRPHLLCASLDAISHVEKIVIKNHQHYDRRLMDSVGFDCGRPITPRVLAMTATARQRAEACLLTLQD
jgi:hypothetical protein